jgi:hypothetical protein
VSACLVCFFRLQDLGFSREQCLAALRNTNGNEDVAASILFGGF